MNRLSGRAMVVKVNQSNLAINKAFLKMMKLKRLI